jgi:hypothetical protein
MIVNRDIEDAPTHQGLFRHESYVSFYTFCGTPWTENMLTSEPLPAQNTSQEGGQASMSR